MRAAAPIKAPTHDPMTVLRAMGLVEVALMGAASVSFELALEGVGVGIDVGVVVTTGGLVSVGASGGALASGEPVAPLSRWRPSVAEAAAAVLTVMAWEASMPSAEDIFSGSCLFWWATISEEGGE